MAWRIVDDAAVDMQHVAEDGMLNFGDNHARMYTLKLVEMFDQLATTPYLARERQAANSLVRLMPCGSHNILYIVENEDVIVLRVLHGLQDCSICSDGPFAHSNKALISCWLPGA